MRLLDRFLPDAPAPGAPSADAYERARSGYALSCAGLYTRGARRLERALEELGRPGADPRLRARSLALAGMADRASADWSRADARLGEAADRLLEIGEPPLASLCLALQVEARCATGALEAGRTRLEELAGKLRQTGPGLAEPALAAAALARGELEEARALAETAERALADGPNRAWAQLLLAEARLDAERPHEARPPLEALIATLEQAGALSEAYVRARLLLARASIELLWSAGAEPDEAGVRAAREALRLAAGYGTNLPRYRAGALALEAQLAALRGAPDADERGARALAALAACGARLDEARAIARWAALHGGWRERPQRLLVARGRDLLTRAGAHPRSQALARLGASGEPQGSLALGASVLGSSMLGRSIAALGMSGEEVQLEAVFAVNRALSSILELEPLLQRILDEVVQALKAERGALLRRQPDGSLTCVAARQIDPARVREGGEEIPFSVVREAERTGAAVLADNAQLDERFRGKASVLATDVRSLLCAPLRTQKALYGFLYLDSRVGSRLFKPEHQELLSVFATQAAVALENALVFEEIEGLNRGLERKVEERTAELARANQALAASLEQVKNVELKLLAAEKEALEKEMAVARGIQQSIVPPPVLLQRPGARLAGRLEPATQVGGDFWTYLELPGDRTLLLVGDATGHGVGAGMLTAVAKSCGATLLRRQGDVDPEALLQTLSDVIWDSSRGQMMMTAFACLIDPASRTLQFANAGHNTPYVVEAGGGLPKVGALVARGSPLGGQLGTRYPAQSRRYGPGDRLVLFTDGLIECTDAAGEAYGERRLRKTVLAGATLPLDGHLAAIAADASAHFAAHPRADDVTVVLAELL